MSSIKSRRYLPLDYDEHVVKLLAGSNVDKDAARRYLRIKRIDLKLSRVRPQDVILDVGCGFGQDCILFSKLGCFAVGIDVSKDFLHMKKTVKSFSCEFIRASAFRLPFRNESFDTAVSYSSIEHCKANYLEWIKEMKRVTKRGGYITLTTSNKLNLLIVILAIIVKVIKRKFMEDYFERFFSPKEFQSILKAGGLKVVLYDAAGLYYHGYPLTPSRKLNRIMEVIAFFLEQKFKVLRLFGVEWLFYV